LEFAKEVFKMRKLEPEQYDNCVLLQPIEDAPEGRVREEEYKLRESKKHVDYFVDGQFIVTGLPNDIQVVVDTAVEGSRLIHSVAAKRPGRSSESPEYSKSELPSHTLFPLDRLEDLEVRLYEIPDKSLPVGEAIGSIYRTALQMLEEEVRPIEFGVYADPNYLTGRPPPIKLSADPDCVEAGPAAPPQGAIDGFMETQWALGQEGIKLFDDARPVPQRCTDRRGQGIRIGIFDTSPFEDQGGWRIPWIDPALELCVHHPEEFVPLKSPGYAPNIADHGLFVAGLIHIVAPESEIHLIRVINDWNQGALVTLVNALQLFSDRMMDAGGRLNGTLVNLSLGVHPPHDMRAAGLEDLEEWVRQTSLWNTRVYEPPTEGSVTIASLHTALLTARKKGAVIVAAAGNDSRDPPEVKLPQIPASYPFVIGVAGSNFCGDRACFSNAGDVAAPSGDVGRAGKDTVKNCNRWPGFCLTSLAKQTKVADQERAGSPRRPEFTGFAHWIGTSFATPLVSGQAALLLEGMGPDGVRRAIEGSAVKPTPPDPNLGAGVIDLPKSLPTPP
jgi:F0F1-type ATP synthase epsilon subunit